eukprot:6414802-Alexandrium_andersonii.AAC.1
MRGSEVQGGGAKDAIPFAFSPLEGAVNEHISSGLRADALASLGTAGLSAWLATTSGLRVNALAPRRRAPEPRGRELGPNKPQ